MVGMEDNMDRFDNDPDGGMVIVAGVVLGCVVLAALVLLWGLL